jgi:hypothetical protein
MSKGQQTYGLLHRLRRAAGLDFHVLLTLVFRGWAIVAGGLTTVLLPLWLTPSQQGYFYTFGSLLALQVFFELGLNQVISQLVSHEAAHLQFHANGSVLGDSRPAQRLAAIIRLVRRWYSAAALLFAIVAGGAGWAFFGRKGNLSISEWLPIWGALVLFSAVNLFLSPRLAVIEGTGQVGQVARLRLIQSVAGYAAMWLGLSVGAGLWVAVAVPAISAVATLVWLHTNGALLRELATWHRDDETQLSWRRDVLPLQWRIAVSWASGYFIFNLFTPIVFAHHGPLEAGRLGMAMAVFNAVTTLGLSWINAKAPSFAMHISRHEYAALDVQFRAVTMRSTAFTALLAFGVLAAVTLAARVGLPGVERIAGPWVLLWLACATTLNVVVFAAATYMRAHREEPMMPVSVVTALLTLAAVAASLDADVSLMMALYAAIGACVTLPWTLALLHRYRTRHCRRRTADAAWSGPAT